MNMSSVDSWLEMTEKYIQPTWKRLGFTSAPDINMSGQGIGIIILDEIIPNDLINHLGTRLKQVKVDDDYQVICTELTKQETQPINGAAEHGMMTLQLLAHLPLKIQNQYHVGIAPAANFIILSEDDPKKIKVALKWILQKRDEWNIKIVLSTLVPSTQEIGSMKSTSKDPYVQALKPAIESGLLIVAPNGNSKAHNNLHPIQFFTVGGYDDEGLANTKKHSEHPAVPWGRNGDGHIRPDILAPFTYLPIPYCESKKSNRALSYFGGTCGSAALVAGVCAHLFSKYPNLTNDQLRSLLMNNGDSFKNGNNFAPKICVEKVNRALSLGSHVIKSIQNSPNIKIKDAKKSLLSKDPVERALSITKLIDDAEINRERLWELLQNESSIVRKTIISYGLGAPINEFERDLYWKHFYSSEKVEGESISWLYQLLWNSNENELDRWIKLIKENDLEINLCIKIYLEKNFPDSPKIQYHPITNFEFISISTKQVLEWYNNKRDT